MPDRKSRRTSLIVSTKRPLALKENCLKKMYLKKTWIDPVTRLEWQVDSPGKMNWHEAIAYAKAITIADRKDWRLPTCKELETLFDRTVYRPILRHEVPFQELGKYWSVTTFGKSKKNAWIVMFDGAYILSYYKTNAYRVRCVRG